MTQNPPQQPTENVADTIFTHQILNYLSSLMQGSFAEMNLLQQFKHPKFDEMTLITNQRGLDRIAKWLSAALNGDSLFSESSKELESFDGQTALEMLKKVRDALSRSIESLLEFSARNTLPSSPELAELLAISANAAFARDSYVRGFIEFGRRTGLIEMIQQYAPALAESGYQTGIIKDLVARLKKDIAEENSIAAGDLPRALYATTRNTIVMLRAQLHDIRQIIAKFEGSFDFETAGFTAEQRVSWEEKNVGPVVAGYWQAYEFNADQYTSWTASNIFQPQLAATWRGLGFTPPESAAWMAQQINPFIASRFRSSGYTPAETRASLEKGEQIPVAKQQAA